MTPTWPTPAQIEQSARALDPEAWAILDSDSIGMMTRRKVSLEQARKALRAVNPYKWREIDDTARDGSWWWGYWPTEEECDRQCPMRWVEDEQRFVDNADHREFHQPTKYMPLPPSPEGDK